MREDINWNGFVLSDGDYDSVHDVYRSLTDKEKNLVTPGRSDYGNFTKSLAARTVAYDGKTPAGFVDIYGPYKKPGRRNGWYTVETAVRDGYRGRGLSPDMARDAIRKVVEKIRDNRRDAVSRGFSLPIPGEPDVFIWNFLRGNANSESAARRAGFFRRSRRSYMMPMSLAEKITDASESRK